MKDYLIGSPSSFIMRTLLRWMVLIVWVLIWIPMMAALIAVHLLGKAITCLDGMLMDVYIIAEQTMEKVTSKL